VNQPPVLIPIERIERSILLIRGEKVMLDADLAEIYGVETKVLNQAVKRNIIRFPEDFMFQLTETEKNEVVTNCDHLTRIKFSPHLPFAFTEHGALMLANVLNSERAALTSVQVVRAFVRLRQMLASNTELSRKLATLEKKYDAQFKIVFEAIRQLMTPPEPKRREIGFHVKYDDDKPKAKKQ
jgi:ORF6N domain